MGCSFQRNITEKISDPEFTAERFNNEIKIKKQRTLKIQKKAMIFKGKNFLDCYDIISSAGSGGFATCYTVKEKSTGIFRCAKSFQRYRKKVDIEISIAKELEINKELVLKI